MTLERVREQPVEVEGSRENVAPESGGASRVQPSSNAHSTKGPKDTGGIVHSTPVESRGPSEYVTPAREERSVTPANGPAPFAWETYHNKAGPWQLNIIYTPKP